MRWDSKYFVIPVSITFACKFIMIVLLASFPAEVVPNKYSAFDKYLNIYEIILFIHYFLSLISNSPSASYPVNIVLKPLSTPCLVSASRREMLVQFLRGNQLANIGSADSIAWEYKLQNLARRGVESGERSDSCRGGGGIGKGGSKDSKLYRLYKN